MLEIEMRMMVSGSTEMAKLEQSSPALGTIVGMKVDAPKTSPITMSKSFASEMALMAVMRPGMPLASASSVTSATF